MTSDKITGTAAKGAMSGGTDDMIESDDVPAPKRNGMSAACHGFIEGTKIATRRGWRNAEALVPGDMVLTFDHGFQPLIDVRREVSCLNDAGTGSQNDPLLLPEGALGNFGEMYVLPKQGLLIESEAVEDAYGDPFAVVNAEALSRLPGVRRVAPQQKFEVITLIFEIDQVIYAEGGILFHCPRETVPLNDVGSDSIGYEIIPDEQSEFVVENMMPVVQHSLPDRPFPHAA